MWSIQAQLAKVKCLRSKQGEKYLMTFFKNLAAFALLVLSVFDAYATSASDLDSLQAPEQCRKETASIKYLVTARDEGKTEAWAQEYVKTLSPADSISPEAVANTFRYKSLPYIALRAYSFWTCHARAYGVPTLALAEVAPALQECFTKPFEPVVGVPCFTSIRSKVLGLPADYSPPPPVPPAPMVLRARCIPEPISNPAASYPNKQILTGRSGIVNFTFQVLPDGSVNEVRALDKSTYGFVEITLATVKRWKFKPFTCGAGDEGVWINSAMTFDLK